jgi:hypothetical protein
VDLRFEFGLAKHGMAGIANRPIRCLGLQFNTANREIGGPGPGGPQLV